MEWIDISDQALRASVTAAAGHGWRLRTVSLGHAPKVTDSGMIAFVRAFPNVEDIVMRYMTGVTDTFLYEAGNIWGRCMVTFCLTENMNITDEGLSHFIRSSPQLQYFDVGLCVKITDESVNVLLQQQEKKQRKQHLKGLSLRGCCGVTDGTIVRVARSFSYLEYLVLDRTGITSPSLDAIVGKLSHLVVLDVSWCRLEQLKVNATGKEKEAQAVRACFGKIAMLKRLQYFYICGCVLSPAFESFIQTVCHAQQRSLLIPKTVDGSGDVLQMSKNSPYPLFNVNKW